MSIECNNQATEIKCANACLNSRPLLWSNAVLQVVCKQLPETIPRFQASCQAILRFCPRAKPTSKQLSLLSAHSFATGRLLRLHLQVLFSPQCLLAADAPPSSIDMVIFVVRCCITLCISCPFARWDCGTSYQ